jgi:exodeoxyribonuclease VII large subunit
MIFNIPSDQTDHEPLIHSVSELNQMVRTLLEDAFLPIWVEGEISNFMCPSSGHWYFTLKDAGAQIRCAMFQGRNRVLSFQPKNGAHILLRGKISLYEPRGDFQLIADYMEEAGDGALQRAFERLKAQLNAEGLFATEYKKPIPYLPKTVGVITSPTGAAIRDILTVFKRRSPSINIVIYPTAVQGEQAAPQIVRALQIANERAECDVIILGRGGGSREDLWAFNEEIVARAIFNSTIPVVSAVGHEVDFTIADFVADQRAPTPSAAAELISPDQQEQWQTLSKIHDVLLRQTHALLFHHRNSLNHLAKRLRHPGQRIQEQFQRLDSLEQRLLRSSRIGIDQRQQQLATLSRALDAISPLATLMRGYAIATLAETGAILYGANQANVGDKISVRLSEGKIQCIVNQLK